MAKVWKCDDVMPGCDKVIQGKNDEEVFAKAEEHVRREHNMHFIVPSVMDKIEAAIREKA